MSWAVRAGQVLGALSVLPVLLWSAGTPEPRRFVDLAVYQQAGRTLLAGGGDLYSFATPNGLSFTYPPFAALLAVPLGPLPGLLAGLLWAALTVVVLGWLVHRVSAPVRAALCRRWGAAGALAGGGLLAVALWLQPLRDSVRFGQVGVLLAALVVADCTSVRPRWPRGLLVGLAAAVKLTPALFIPYLWLSGRRRAALVAAATAAAVTLVTAVLLPGASRAYWTGALLHPGRLGDNADGGNQSVRGMLLRSGWPGWLQAALLVVAVVLLLVVGLRRAARASDEVAGLAVVGCLAVAVSPVSWIHHLVWLVPAAAVLAGDLRSRLRVGLAVAMLGCAAARLPWQADALLRAGVPGRPLWLVVQSLLGLIAVAVVLALPLGGGGRRRPEPAAVGSSLIRVTGL